MKTLSEVLTLLPPNGEIQAAAAKTMDHIDTHDRIMVSVSGGSDSDIVVDLFELIGYEPGQVIYVWFDTGLEYEATKRHLDFLERRYNTQIHRHKTKKPIPTSIGEYGVPFISKLTADYIGRLQKHGFQWEDGGFEELYAKYPKCKSALRWWCDACGRDSAFTIARAAGLREYIQRNPPPRISDKCCEYAKKAISNELEAEYGCDLSVTGVRRAEGGIRATAYKSCYTPEGKHSAKFRPIFYFSDRDKREYEKFRGIVHSDCYTVYGFKRTGCACCPFGSNFERELEIVRQYEPKLYKAACAIFGPSYEYTRKYREFREKYKAEKRRHWQIGFFDNWTEDEAQKGGEDDDI